MLTLLTIILGILLLVIGGIILLVGVGPILVIGGAIFSFLFDAGFALFIIAILVIYFVIKKRRK